MIKRIGLILGVWILFCFFCPAQCNKTVQIRNGLPNIFKKLAAQKEVTIAFFGGSITNHPGYRVYVTKWLEDQFPLCHINSINAGVGGTGSGLGVFRMDEDVLDKKPDMVFVEFAVNDGGTDSLMLLHSMEGIVRKIWKQNITTDICFLYTAGMNNLIDLNKGINPRSSRIMEQVATHYKLPSIQMGFVVANMVTDGKIDFKGVKGSTTVKPFFSDDGTHPTINFGHHIYADTIEGALKQMRRMNPVSRKAIPVAIDINNNENANTYSITEAKMEGGWKILPKDQSLAKQFADKFSSIAAGSDAGSNLTIKFKGTQIGFYDILGPTSGKLKAVIDDGKPIYITRFDTYCVYSRANNFMFPMLKEGIHTLVVSPDSSVLDKIGILNKRHTAEEIGDFQKYAPQNVYLGKILVLGKLIQ